MRRWKSGNQHLEALLTGIPGLGLQRVGSLFWLVLQPVTGTEPVRTPAGFSAGAVERFPALFHGLLARGCICPQPLRSGLSVHRPLPEDLGTLAAALTAALTGAGANPP